MPRIISAMRWVGAGFSMTAQNMMFLPFSQRSRGVVAVAGLLLALAGCSSTGSVGSSVASLGGMLQPYKVDVVQGNVITREQAEAVKPGMTRDQVHNIMGTPLLVSVFHSDRWDYVFTFRRQGQEPQRRQVTVFFKGNVVDHLQVDEQLPSEAEFVQTLDSRRKGAKVPALEATEEQLKAFEAKNPVTPKADSTEPAPKPATSYPPLEAR